RDAPPDGDDRGRERAGAAQGRPAVDAGVWVDSETAFATTSCPPSAQVLFRGPLDRPWLMAPETTSYCARCGTSLAPGAYFCLRCGTSVPVTAGRASAQVAPPSPPPPRRPPPDAP